MSKISLEKLKINRLKNVKHLQNCKYDTQHIWCVISLLKKENIQCDQLNFSSQRTKMKKYAFNYSLSISKDEADI